MAGKRPLVPVELSRNDIAFLQYTGAPQAWRRARLFRTPMWRAMSSRPIAWLRPFVDDPQIMVTALRCIISSALRLLSGDDEDWRLLSDDPNPRDIGGFVKTLRKSRFTMFSGVNTLYAALADHSDFDKVDFSGLVFCLSGGMATLDVTAPQMEADHRQGDH